MNAVRAHAFCKWRSFSSGLLALLLPVFLLAPASVHAQDWARCDTASESELNRNIRKHDEHMYRMMKKFKHVWYLQGALPKDYQGFDLADLKSALRATSDPQTSGVLFYAYASDKEKLCVWVIRGSGEVEGTIRKVNPEAFDSMRPELLAALGAVPPGRIRDRKEIRRISADLVPPAIENAIQTWGLSRLFVVPIFDLGEMPYAALALDDGRVLMDVVKVTILPGFFVFSEHQRTPKGKSEDSVVAAYGGKSAYALQFAQASAKSVAALLGVTEPVLSDRASVVKRLELGPPPRFIFIAAHGISNTLDPVDGGKVELADGPWNGREVSQLPEKSDFTSHPIVVLSACESGLGKMFEVGSIGLSRAWYYAGASSVVSSLWRVDEFATMELMNYFVENTKTMPVADALWAAMKSLRDQGDDVDPMYWAAFSIFGGLP